MSSMHESGHPFFTVSRIHRLNYSDGVALKRIRQELDPVDGLTVERLVAELDHLAGQGGTAWILRRDPSVAGFASVMPLPGLPGVYELNGFVAPAFQRQGLGSKLLESIINDLADSPVRQLSCSTPSMSSPAARFLLKHGFVDEHEEHLLVLDDLAGVPAVKPDANYSLLTLSQRQAISHFRRLYEAAFAGLAWYQPYDDDQEVAEELGDSGDLLFLADRSQPIGFLWLRWPALQTAEIEPLGLLPSYQGRGLGSRLMLAGLNLAARQGAVQVRVAAWSTNTVALKLYGQLGFRFAQSKHYLAFDL